MSRTYLVTGAASGIGRAVARKLLAKGEHVCAADIDEDGLASLREEMATDRLTVEVLDVRDSENWERVFDSAADAHGSVETLMNIAGVVRVGRTQEVSADDIDFQLGVNVKGVMLGTAIAARHMLPKLHGHIINVASLAGLAPVPGITVYSATKFAVRGFSLAAAQDLRPHGIQVSVVCPDLVDTPMLDTQKNDERAALSFSGNRALTTEEVAGIICGRVVDDAPLEISIPPSRGALARLAGSVPSTSGLLMEPLRRKGLKNQSRYD